MTLLMILVGIALAAAFWVLYRKLQNLGDEVQWLRTTLYKLLDDTAYTRLLVRGNVPEEQQIRGLIYLHAEPLDAATREELARNLAYRLYEDSLGAGAEEGQE